MFRCVLPLGDFYSIQRLSHTCYIGLILWWHNETARSRENTSQVLRLPLSPPESSVTSLISKCRIDQVSQTQHCWRLGWIFFFHVNITTLTTSLTLLLLQMRKAWEAFDKGWQHSWVSLMSVFPNLICATSPAVGRWEPAFLPSPVCWQNHICVRRWDMLINHFCHLGQNSIIWAGLTWFKTMASSVLQVLHHSESHYSRSRDWLILSSCLPPVFCKASQDLFVVCPL